MSKTQEKTKISETIKSLLARGVPDTEHDRIIATILALEETPSIDNNRVEWQPFNRATKGTVLRDILYQDQAHPNKNVLVVLKYSHAEVDFHVHAGNEWVLVLEGYQETYDHQHYPVFQKEMKIENDLFRYTIDDGVILNKPGTGHRVRSEACIALVFYEELPIFEEN